MVTNKTTASTSKRAALRAQQEVEEAAKKRRRIVSVVIGVIVIAAITVGVVLGVNHKSNSSSPAQQITPPSATKDGVYTLNPGKAKKGAPTVTVFQDYQCPACKGVEDALGKQFNELSAKGDIKLQYRTMTFLDHKLANDASSRAAMAAAAADVVGRYGPYHDVIYAHQAAKEGVGYTDDQLRKSFAAQAGITGDKLTKFQHIYDTRQTEQFVQNASDQGLQAMQKLGAEATPAYAVNGKPWDGWGQLSSSTTSDELLKVIVSAQ